MARGRRLYQVAAIIAAAAGIMMGLVSPASADTGSGGFTILYASSHQGAHKCNVIGDDGTYQAVVCSDLVTAENSTQYDVHGQAEAICQRSKTHVVVPCESVNIDTSLATGNGSVSAAYGPQCGGDVPCPDGRYYVSTPNWVYNIANSAPACWSNAGSAYLQWDVVWGQGWATFIQTPDGSKYYLADAPLNDGANESTGHYYICP
jgi:hypothetical protein